MVVACKSDGSSSSAAADGGVCTSSTSSACVGDSGCYWCPPSWSEALADRSFCVPSCGYQHEFLFDCGDYQSLMRAADDCSLTYYYEKSTGTLVALFSACTSQAVCDFGPFGFSQPTTCSPWVEVYPCGDGGADGGTE